jgi:hypothetical protein
VVGVIMRPSKVSGRKSANLLTYDVAWEHTSLGETSVSTAHLIGGNQAGAQIATLRQQASSKVNSTKNCVTINKTRTGGRSKRIDQL